MRRFLGNSGDAGGSASGSMSTESREDNWLLSAEDSCCPDDYELDLGLDLTLGGGTGKALNGCQQQYARFFTARGSSSSSSSSSYLASATSPSSSSSSTLSAARTKTSADSVAAANGVSQVVGWPPIRAYRMSSMTNQVKSPATGVYKSIFEESKSNLLENTNKGKDENNDNNAKESGHGKRLFVKVNMDGISIGRKVDLNAHSCYETLAQTLENMFQCPTITSNSECSVGGEHAIMVGVTRPSKLLDESSEFALTYQDKEHDWMLVGDVPWGMFLNSVNRLRIMRINEANGLAPGLQKRNGR